jgi:hypothetical protein
MLQLPRWPAFYSFQPYHHWFEKWIQWIEQLVVLLVTWSNLKIYFEIYFKMLFLVVAAVPASDGM